MLTDTDIDAAARIRDVSKLFTLSRAEFCPFSTMAPKGPKPKSTLYEWFYKIPHTPSDNAMLDTQDLQDSEIINNEANKKKVAGRTQYSRVAIGISLLAQEFASEYPVDDLKADNLKDALQLARESLEVQCLKQGDSNIQGSAGPTDPGRMRGALGWVRTANPNAGDLPIPDAILSPSGNILSGVSDVTTVLDTHFNAIMQSIATAAREKGVWDVFVSPELMAVIDSYTRNGRQTVSDASNTVVPLRRFNADMTTKEITMEVRFYQTSFGRIRFHLHFSLPSGVHAAVFNMSRNKLRPGIPVRTRDLEYRGGGYKTILEWVFGLDGDPLGSGKITT